MDMRLEFMAVLVGWLVGQLRMGTNLNRHHLGRVRLGVWRRRRWIPSSMVVNRRSSAGEFIGQDMEFLVRVKPGDTLVFGAVGYHSLEKVSIRLPGLT